MSCIFLTGFYQYETTLLVSSGLIVFLVGIVLALVGLLFVNKEDKLYHKAAGWLYMSLALVLFVLVITRLSVITAAFILNLVAFYMILRGMPAAPENKEVLRGRLDGYFVFTCSDPGNDQSIKKVIAQKEEQPAIGLLFFNERKSG